MNFNYEVGYDQLIRMNRVIKNKLNKIKKLKKILQFSKNDHHREVFRQKNIKMAHMHCKVNGLSGQVAGPLLEKWIISKYQMSRVKSSQGRKNMPFALNTWTLVGITYSNSESSTLYDFFM